MWKIFFKTILAYSILNGSIVLGGEIQQLKMDDKSSLMRPKAFTLHNSTGMDISFFLGQEGEGLSKYGLFADNVQEFSDGRSNQYIISIPTADRGSVRYILKSGKRYQIYWNYTIERWDLVELGNR